MVESINSVREWIWFLIIIVRNSYKWSHCRDCIVPLAVVRSSTEVMYVSFFAILDVFLEIGVYSTEEDLSMKLKYVAVDSTNRDAINTCNVMSVAPIRETNDELILWRPFFNALPRSVLDYLATLKYKVQDEVFSIPDEPQAPASDKLNRVLTLYFDSFDYQHHHDERTMGIANIIPVPEKHKEEMADITNIRLQTDRPITKFLERDAIEYLLPLIRDAMMSHPRWFIKLSTQSSKHDFPIQAVETAEDVLDTITKSRKLLQVEWQRRNKPTYVILKPWNPLITQDNEFRVFVWENKITAVTQQHWYEQLNHSQGYIDTVLNVMHSYVHSPKLPSICVIDVIILENATLIILELNPWICSGSGLFEWSMDYKILYGLEGEAELRLAKAETD